MECKGWIALDIDGTITLDRYSVPEPVISYLRRLQQSGWRIAVATGRPFHFASIALSAFDFPFILLCQNGSVTLEMPLKTVFLKRYLQWSDLPFIEQAYEGINSDFVVYAGVERGDICYFRPKRFPQDEWSAVKVWQSAERETWQECDQFTSELIPTFPLAKCFGPPERMKKIAERLKTTKRFQAPLMRNPFDEGSSIVLVTEPNATKGLALTEVFQSFGRGPLVIGAGDDENDLSLLDVADIKIAMAHAPYILRSCADIVAPPTSEMGIIHALQMAIGEL